MARRRKLEPGDVAIGYKVTLHPTEDRTFDQSAVELVRAADLVCPYSNAIRGNVEVDLTANGVAALARFVPQVGEGGQNPSVLRGTRL